ncbi:FAD-dependent oxidoreductase [Sphingobacterium corticibacter]|uniref:FAD-dependent monooxygenase n=1 Tax=Sphingobacterium corticibacter TaxID=2171749 RepID=A0A2T8HM08_9SPHI|nr:NAD(P)/FAD-dependent oxidoreductase [Sphingobacterium corticibacter]PVH26478.1 FAD-dependent monooxygenase [Sphingobacterium corticibacter]
MEDQQTSWTICLACRGEGKKSRKLRKKVRLQHQLALAQFEQAEEDGTAPSRPKAHRFSCAKCAGSGLIPAARPPMADHENYPHVAIIGGGIGGMALAVALLHRGIPFTLYERDSDFNARPQGYGLTLQQASKAIEGFGITSLTDGVISTRHVVHTTAGKVVGEWGVRRWIPTDSIAYPKRSNVHIARQSLRLELLKQLGNYADVQWGHQLVDFERSDDNSFELSFQVDGRIERSRADLVVGADGIRSSVSRLVFSEDHRPLRYLGCIVILGICPLAAIKNVDSELLDSATVFQTANGHERIYMMPYTSDSIMWQLSFPLELEEAKTLSAAGASALKEEACRRTQWHNPIPQILAATMETQISGYPVYDRELLQQASMAGVGSVTLIGDAAHPMSPFKGQGANQALLDALNLARGIYKGCNPHIPWRTIGLRKSVLSEFEAEMLARSAVKVKDSAEAAEFLHSDIILHEGDEPRGRCLKSIKNSSDSF